MPPRATESHGSPVDVAASPRPAARTATVGIRRAVTREDWTDARRLLADYVEWLRISVGVDPLVAQPGFGAEVADPQCSYGNAGGALFLAAEPGRRAGAMVAVRHHHDGSAELKRLYVDPSLRGCGLGDRLVAAVVTTVERVGIHDAARPTRLWLETVAGVMDPAITIYRRHGFEIVPASTDRTTVVGVPELVLMERAA